MVKFLLFFALCFITTIAFADTGEFIRDTIMPVVIDFVGRYPKLSIVLAIMSVSRAVFKPIMVILEKYVMSTKTKSDDIWLANLKKSKYYKCASFLVDYVFSVKLSK